MTTNTYFFSRKMIKSLLFIAILIASSVIYNACCDTKTTIISYKTLHFYGFNGDSVSYNNAKLSTSFDVTYSQTTKSTSLFITNAQADAIRFCENKFNDVYNDSIVNIKVYNLLNSTDITNQLCPEYHPELSLTEYLKNSHFVKTIIFKAPYPATQNYKLLMEVTLHSGTVLRDTTDEFHLIHY